MILIRFVKNKDQVTTELLYIVTGERDDIMLQLPDGFCVEMIRNPFTLWSTDRSYKYLCTFKFYNSVHQLVSEFTCSEITVFQMLDSFEQFFEMGMDSCCIPLEVVKPNGEYDMIVLERMYQDHPSEHDPILFSFRTYNKFSEMIINRFSIRFTEEFFSDIFCYHIYFAFLIDIDDGNYINDCGGLIL